MRLLLAVSDAIKNALQVVAFASAWLLIVLMFITCTDVVGRKLGIPIPLTKFQELEWYMHTALFSMWMGYNYVINAHPRVDSYTETLKFRIRAWIEFWGCLLFALPYCYLLVYHGWDFFWVSYWQDEGSENAVGLEHRWLIKGVFYIGLWLLLAGVVSVMLRVIVFLFGDRPPSEVDLRIGHAELEV
jgi:TRAP-type mannitol/chloroaromatic compound transport system permease small subunit